MPRDNLTKFQQKVASLPARARHPARFEQWKLDNGFADVEQTVPADAPGAPTPVVPDPTASSPPPTQTPSNSPGRFYPESEEPPRRLHALHRPWKTLFTRRVM